MAVHPSKDPLWLLNKDEAVRLCRVYDEEMGIMYPMLDIDKIIRHAIRLFAFIESAVRTGLVQRSLLGHDNLDDDDTRILKMVLAAALVVEGSGQSELGGRLFETVRQYAESSLWGPVNTNQLKLLVLVVCVRRALAEGGTLSLNRQLRHNITSRWMKKLKLTESSDLLHGCAWSWVCIEGRFWLIPLLRERNALGRSSFSGLYMSLTGGGALERVCHLHYKTQILTRSCWSR